MELHDPDYFEEALYDVPEIQYMDPSTQQLWLAKSSLSNQGKGIFMFSSVEELEEIMTDPQHDHHLHRYWVLQRYVEPPMLFDERKFHVRVYCLAVGNLQVWTCKDALALFSSYKYSGEGDEEERNLGKYLTNTCFQQSRSEGALEEDLVKDLKEVLTEQELESFWTQVRETIHDVFSCVHFEPASFQALPRCFEMYGLDFVLRQDGQVFFLEANPTPDFAMTGSRCKYIPEGFIRACMTLGIDQQLRRIPKAFPFDISAEQASQGLISQGNMWLSYSKLVELGESGIKFA
jgi:hypothetical protein